MKVPTTGTSVFAPIARTGTGATATVTGVGFAPDLVMTKRRDVSPLDSTYVYDKLRGIYRSIYTDSTAEEFNRTNGVQSFDMSGVSLGTDAGSNASGGTYVNWFFRRAPGFFDEVCYTGDAGFLVNYAHNLTVRPELVISKRRNSTNNWAVAVRIGNNSWRTSNATGGFVLNSTASTVQVLGYDAFFTPTHFGPGFIGGGWESSNTLGATYVAYLFASCPGVSKVGSYTGNGSNQTINCGFAAGARFILIKRTDSTGDWYVWDTARGIVTGNDPHLSLNTTSTEVTSNDSIDPESSGFIVNQLAATDINVNAATYIFLAIA
jgi:hypothetical protein